MTINRTILIITACIATLKLAGEINISWWLVTILLWLPTTIIILAFMIIVFIAYSVQLGTIDKKTKGKGEKVSENKAKQYMDMAAIQNVINDIPQIIEMAKLQAKLKKVNYDALIKEGFSPAQAIHLCGNKKS